MDRTSLNSKDKDAFIKLELESRRITAQILDLTERRSVMAKCSKQGVLRRFSGFEAGFDAWLIETSEQLMAQLREVANEMSVVRRRAMEREPESILAFQLEQEYYRKVQLLETLKNIGEFNSGEDVAFYRSFHYAWSSDCSYGCFHF
jgi:hypothetical protein